MTGLLKLIWKQIKRSGYIILNGFVPAKDVRDDDWRFISAVEFRLTFIPLIFIIQTLFWTLLFFVPFLLLTWFTVGVPSQVLVVLLGITIISGILSIPKPGASFTVPNTHVGILTVFGQRYDLFLLEGDYPDFTTGWIFGLSKEELPNSKTDGTSFTAVGGFVNMGKVQFQIWNNMEKRSPQIENIARNGANITANLLIELQVFDPRRLLDSGDPLLAISERSRTAFRDAISFFIDRDCATVKTILVDLMMGNTIITSFINDKRAKMFEQGMIIRDAGGRAMIDVLQDMDRGKRYNEETDEIEKFEETKKEFQERLDEAIKQKKEEFRQEMEDDADVDMLELIPNKKGETGKKKVYDKSVDKSLDEVLESVGVELNQASVSNIQFSAPVKESADKAASEAFQAKSMLDSAAAQADAEKKLHVDREGRKMDDLDRILVAGQDNPRIRASHVSTSGSGANSGLIAAAEVIANKGKKDNNED